jgi:catechol 2,3-dioxygenase-like lactoylglutathione lyase family enzyme
MRIVSLALVIAALASCSRAEPPLAAMAADALHGKGEMTSAIPILRVSDLARATKYWRDVLGFQVEWMDGEPPDFAAVKRGDAVFFMCQRCQGRGASWSFVFTKDVDKLHQELVGRGAIIARAPKNEPWRLREMHVADRDGNVVRFGSPIRH